MNTIELLVQDQFSWAVIKLLILGIITLMIGIVATVATSRGFAHGASRIVRNTCLSVSPPIIFWAMSRERWVEIIPLLGFGLLTFAMVGICTGISTGNSKGKKHGVDSFIALMNPLGAMLVATPWFVSGKFLPIFVAPIAALLSAAACLLAFNNVRTSKPDVWILVLMIIISVLLMSAVFDIGGKEVPYMITLWFVQGMVTLLSEAEKREACPPQLPSESEAHQV